MVSALVSKSNHLGLGPDWGDCVVFLGKTLHSQSHTLTLTEVYKWVPANLML